MTKHFFTHPGNEQEPRTLNVDAGYDRPCGHFYLNVEDGQAQDEDEEQVYISMYDPKLFTRERGAFMGGLTLDELKAKFTELHITPPAGLLEVLNEDARLGRGNAVRHW